jgi:hypothetical protein
MNLTITIDTEQYPDMPWPEGIPLPSAGDQVTVNHAGENVCFVVDRCAFDLTTTNHDSARVHIYGHHAPAGSI